MIICFIIFINCDKYDKYGAIFSDDEHTELISVPSGITDYVLTSKASIISGGSETTSPFYGCKNKLKTLKFENDSKLNQIKAYGLANLQILQLDFSNCRYLTVIEERALYNCSLLQELILPPNLEKIQTGGLSYLTSLPNITFPSTLKMTGGWASGWDNSMGYCKNLSKVTFSEPVSITSIGSNTFFSCGLVSFVIPSTVTSLGSSVFNNNPLVRIEVDTKNTVFSADGFGLYQDNWKTLIYFATECYEPYVINESVTKILSGCFWMSKTSRVTLPPNIVEIPHDCFFYSNITDIVIPGKVTLINGRSFGWSLSLKSVTIGESVEKIEGQAFRNCVSLESITIPQKCETLNDDIFAECSNLKSIKVLSSIKHLGEGCFSLIHENCSIEFTFNSYVSKEDNIIYTDNSKTLLQFLGGKTEVSIKNSVEKIGKSAFKNYPITSVTFNSNLKSISLQAFRGTKLTSVTFNSGFETVGEEAFRYVQTLTSVTFNNGLQKIEKNAFANSGLIQVSFPKSIQSISDGAFDSVTSLMIVSFDGCNQLTSIGKNCFRNTEITNVIIPINASNINEYIFQGSKLKTLIFQNGYLYNKVNQFSFMGCKYLTNVLFAEGIQVIDRSAFQDCTNLENITFASSIENISINAFKGCIKLSTIKLPKESKLTDISPGAFDGCLALTKFDVSSENDNFYSEDGVLYDKKCEEIILYLPAHSRTEFDVKSTVKFIRAFAFYSAANLQSIFLPNGNISKIGNSAFRYCSSLINITIPDTVSTIDPQAFADCPMLGCGSIIYPPSLYDLLISAGAPADSLIPCPTATFTVGAHSSDAVSSILIATVLVEEDFA